MYVSSRSLSALRVCKQKKKRRGKERVKRTDIRSTESSLLVTQPVFDKQSRYCHPSADDNFVAIQICLGSNENGIKFIGIIWRGRKKEKGKMKRCLSNFSDLFKFKDKYLKSKLLLGLGYVR